MPTIEIDFDVLRAIEAERRKHGDPPNAALRRLLGLGEGERVTDADSSDRRRVAGAKGVARATELRRRVLPFAEAQGWLTDEDVFDAIS